MPTEQTPGKPTTRRYTREEKVAAVRMVRSLRAELGTDQGTVQRVATQLGYGVESVRSWVSQVDVGDGKAPGTTTADARRVRSNSSSTESRRGSARVRRRTSVV